MRHQQIGPYDSWNTRNGTQAPGLFQLCVPKSIFIVFCYPCARLSVCDMSFPPLLWSLSLNQWFWAPLLWCQYQISPPPSFLKVGECWGLWNFLDPFLFCSASSKWLIFGHSLFESFLCPEELRTRRFSSVAVFQAQERWYYTQIQSRRGTERWKW